MKNTTVGGPVESSGVYPEYYYEPHPVTPLPNTTYVGPAIPAYNKTELEVMDELAMECLKGLMKNAEEIYITDLENLGTYSYKVAKAAIKERRKKVE